jgi:hypothetical protein
MKRFMRRPAPPAPPNGFGFRGGGGGGGGRTRVDVSKQHAPSPDPPLIPVIDVKVSKQNYRVDDGEPPQSCLMFMLLNLRYRIRNNADDQPVGYKFETVVVEYQQVGMPVLDITASGSHIVLLRGDFSRTRPKTAPAALPQASILLPQMSTDFPETYRVSGAFYGMGYMRVQRRRA